MSRWHISILRNTSNSLIKKQIFDKVATLACFKYFLNCPRFYLIQAIKVNDVKSDLAADTFVEDFSARYLFVCVIFTADASI